MKMDLPVFGDDGTIRYYDISHLPGILEVLRGQLRIAVIYSGDSSAKESVRFQSLHTRNWKSYEVVAEDIKGTLNKLGFEQVHCFSDDRSLLDNLIKHEIDFAWLNTGGVQGYNPMSHAPGMMEMMGIPYIGHDPLNVSVLDNKDLFKRQMMALGFQTSQFFTWNKLKHGANSYWLEELHHLFGDYTGPFVVKPVSGRASIDVNFAATLAEIPRFVDQIYQHSFSHILIEKYLPGREFCVAIYGNLKVVDGKFIKYDEPFAFSEVERVFEQGEKIFTSMDKKALTNNRFHLLTSKEDMALKIRLQDLARKVYTYLGLNTLIRLDVREDANGNLYLLEVNPKPDLKKPEKDVISIVYLGLKEQGMTYDDLIMSIFATRLHQLFEVQQGYIRHIVEMIAKAV